MIIPVRCFSCNKVIADKWIPYQKRIEAGIHPKNAMTELGLKRYCCRRMFLTHVDLIDKLLVYDEGEKLRKSLITEQKNK